MASEDTSGELVLAFPLPQGFSHSCHTGLTQELPGHALALTSHPVEVVLGLEGCGLASWVVPVLQGWEPSSGLHSKCLYLLGHFASPLAPLEQDISAALSLGSQSSGWGHVKSLPFFCCQLASRCDQTDHRPEFILHFRSVSTVTPFPGPSFREGRISQSLGQMLPIVFDGLCLETVPSGYGGTHL